MVRVPALTLPDLVVLALLAERPLHGYALVAELQRRDVEDWAAISRPHVYYALRKLRRLGLLHPVADQVTPAGPERVVFAPTEAARMALADALAQESWATQRPPPPFLSWLALSGHARTGDMARLILRRRLFLQEQLTRERDTLLAFGADDGAMALAGQAMVTLTIRQFEIELAWLDELDQALAAR
jgi:DNA-binding PadR family transcriptional regulator